MTKLNATIGAVKEHKRIVLLGASILFACVAVGFFIARTASERGYKRGRISMLEDAVMASTVAPVTDGSNVVSLH